MAFACLIFYMELIIKYVHVHVNKQKINKQIISIHVITTVNPCRIGGSCVCVCLCVITKFLFKLNYLKI